MNLVDNFNEKGFTPLILIIGIVLVLVACSVGAFYYQRQSTDSTSTPSPSPQAQASASASASASVISSPTVKPTIKATLTPTSTPKPTSTPTPVNSTRAEPASVNVTIKSSELDKLPTVKIYAPGHHRVAVVPRDGNVGIFGSFSGSNASFDEFTDSTTIKIGFGNAGQGIKKGENKEILDIREAADFFEAINKSDSIISIPVTVTITD